MDKKMIVPVAFLLLILAVALVSVFDESNSSESKVNLIVYSEGPKSLSELVNEIKTQDYYEGYDNETVAWMESLGNKKFYYGDGIIVIMSATDASKLPSLYVTDVELFEHFECNVLENRSLGNVEYPKDVLYVKNVKYIGEEYGNFSGA